MGTDAPKCPACGTAMQRVVEPDVAYDRCPSCGGLFLEPGALNALATGLAGDIEFCSIDLHEDRADVFPPRRCPRCPDQTMRKEDLLSYAGVVFDHCESCHGWFLDRGELRAMNDELAAIRRALGGEAEYRDTHRGHLVTITERQVVTSTASGLGSTVVVPVAWRQVDVYFREPLDRGLRISLETWATRFLSLFGLHDVETGDAAFDKTFLVKADRGADVHGLLGEEARKRLLEFVSSEHAEVGKKHVFEVLDDRVRFAYTDWGKKEMRPTEEARDALIEALVDLALAIDPAEEA